RRDRGDHQAGGRRSRETALGADHRSRRAAETKPRQRSAADEDRERAALEVEQATASRRLVARIGEDPSETQACLIESTDEPATLSRKARLPPHPRAARTGRAPRGEGAVLCDPEARRTPPAL